MVYNELSHMLHSSYLFGGLDSFILDDLISYLKVETVTSGTQIFYEGEVSDRLLIVISGRLIASHRSADGSLKLFNEIGSGESAGEIGLILNQPRSADVTAIRDSNIAILDRSDYELLLLKYPLELNKIFTKIIFEHLKLSKKGRTKEKSFIISLIPLHKNTDIKKLSLALEKSFSKHAKTIYLTLEEAKNRGIDPIDRSKAIEAFSNLESDYEYILCESLFTEARWSGFTLRQADHVLFVSSYKNTTLLDETKIQMERLSLEPNYNLVKKSLVIMHNRDSTGPIKTAFWRDEYRNKRVMQIREDSSSDIDRLARFLTNRALGLVLGGGGARGFAHIGVIKALEEAGIEIDFVGGNSMGALIGAQYVAGKSLDDILKDTLKFATGWELPSIPFISLILGRRVERDIKRLFANRDIDMSWKPFFAVACNLSTAKLSVLDSGSLWRAVLASNSPSGLLPPVLDNGELLVDGAILNNVPVDIMREKIGLGQLIAVDVDVKIGPSVDSRLNRLSALQYLLKKFTKHNENENPNIVDILTRAGHIGALVNRDKNILLSDFYLEPPVGKFSLIGYKRASEIANVGYEYTKEMISLQNISTYTKNSEES